ncbi:hypothetical protein DEO72_LG5g2202 [Vigna unguiculata]|uniref:Uncharacterized protein n=1 Tax=Vigna unguiculata TaxID=3917 RepID=A0A4D6M043_VIGUN|nr:hypothetical protein DEO72_LG5g2202 [Vigna unguiculata]
MKNEKLTDGGRVRVGGSEYGERLGDRLLMGMEKMVKIGSGGNAHRLVMENGENE